MFSISVLGSSLHCGPKYLDGFVISSFISCYLIQSGVVGIPSFTVFFTMFLLLLVGLEDVIQCYLIREKQKKQFTALKINDIISEYQTKLVHRRVDSSVLGCSLSYRIQQLFHLVFGTGTPKDKDEVNRREVCECEG